ncbi:MAG: hypothetical protein ACM3OO_06640 [Planctomycetaceae bacterium]
MSWWVAAMLVWLGVGSVTALAIGRATRGSAPDLRSLVDGLERENQDLWDEVRLERARIAELRSAEQRGRSPAPAASVG